MMYKLGRKNYEIAFKCIFDKLHNMLDKNPNTHPVVIKNEARVVDNITVDKVSLEGVIGRYVYDILNYTLGYNDYIDYHLNLNGEQVSFNNILREQGFCI